MANIFRGIFNCRHATRLQFHRSPKCAPLLTCYLQKRLAGHNKWANIKHTKMARDTERAALSQRYTSLMRVAIKEGGSADPFTNHQLATVIEKAKSLSIPMSTIQTVLKRSQSKDTKSYLLEIRSLSGSFILADILTDNIIRTKQEISTILKKNNAQWCEGSVKHFFEQKGVIRMVASAGETLEQAETTAIEAGAEEVEEVPPAEDGQPHCFQFLCDPKDFGTVRKHLEKDGQRKLDHADLEYLPVNRVSLEDPEIQVLVKLCSKLEEHPDVIKLYDNIA